MKVYVWKSEYNEFIKYQNNPEEFYKKYPGTPLILELWADKDDLRSCAKGGHVKELTINI